MPITSLKLLKAEDAPRVGSKAANLGELAYIGVPVPPGFVVDTQAFDEFMASDLLQGNLPKFINALDYNDPKRLAFIASRIRQLIGVTSWAETIHQQMTDLSKTGQYAVRSSAIGEDTQGTSFAGQHATFLAILPHDISMRVRQCFASLFEPRALAYRFEQGLPLAGAKMAVVVQEMIPADVAGVMFTRDPNTGEEKTVIEAVFGLGEALVSGAVTPDHYEVSSTNVIKAQYTPQAKKMHGQTGEWRDTRPSQQTGSKLTRAQIRRLARYGRIIEDHYGCPQDIEWALWEGEFYILQARPITTTAKVKGEGINAPVLAKGSPASFGAATGPVRVITDLKDLDQVQDGDILVTTMTTPDFVPVFKKIAGIVTDLGGSTCHAAIISREYDLPCVVGTGSATAVLQTGQTVVVDGSYGLIHQG